ncbi:MAG TPA: glycosyltransferase family 39 protein [bacterium]|nr:glycosyltransferase family 39 protein [bacterium]HPQ66637.1 glycosyltransferase family 39 protein [bacterium]
MSLGSRTRFWVLLIFLGNLGLRLALVSWNYATYTDSIDYMTALDRVRGTIILPGYPFAVDLLELLTGDPQLAGRLVSIVFASLCVFPLYGLGRIVCGRRAGLLTVLFYSVSPLLLRWSLRVFPHGMYAFLVLAFLYGIFRSLESGSVWWLAAGVFCGGLGVVTYPTGLILVPVALAAVAGHLFRTAARERSGPYWWAVFLGGWAALGAAFAAFPAWRSAPEAALAFLLGIFPLGLPGPAALWPILLLGAGWGTALVVVSYLLPARGGRPGRSLRRPLELLALAAAFSGYAFLHVWQRYLSMSTWYQEGMKNSMRSLSGRWEQWLTYYLQSYPYVLVYPVAALALVGLVLVARRARRSAVVAAWLVFFIYFLAGVFYTLVANKWWTPRYQYTLVAVTLPLAGCGLSVFFDSPRRLLRGLGWGLLLLSLGASAVFTAFVLYWSRDSFADIRRSADYIREHLSGRRVYSSELRKVGWWARTPVRGYTSGSRSSVRPGDYVLLVGWHTNLATELRYLSSRYPLREVHRETVTIRGLLADDIVDWAGRRLSRRANSPVCWEERFRPQTLESLIVEVLDPETGAGPDQGRLLLPAPGDLPVGGVEHADYFDSGFWEVSPPPAAGSAVVVEMAHARPGAEGSFRMAAYADEDGDGLPDRLLAESPLLESERAGEWSRWEFTSPGGRIFVGSRWSLGNWIYYERGRWIDQPLGEVMFYSRGGEPRNKANPIVTNLKVSFAAATAPAP